MNLFNDLHNCTDATKIDALLTNLGIEDDPKVRLEYLENDIMKVGFVFYSDDTPIEDRYEMAKHDLASQLWK